MWLIILITILLTAPSLLAIAAFRWTLYWRRMTGQAHIRPLISDSATTDVSVDILIPAHNEPLALPYSIAHARTFLQQWPNSDNKILVGLSNWTDWEKARQAASGADSYITIYQPGKWLALLNLIRSSQADWVIVMDAGVRLLVSDFRGLHDQLQTANVLAINPTYQVKDCPNWQKIYWQIEAGYKSLENYAGGAISLHGACIIYHRQSLRAAIEFLAQEGEWIQDDVVIPLTLRAFNPNLKIIYSTELVAWDEFPPTRNSESNRRHRLLVGNLEWSKLFLEKQWYQNLILLGLVARRWIRLLVSWLVLAIGLYFLNIWLLIFCLVLLAALRRLSSSSALEVFWASLLFPVTLFSFSRKIGSVTWK